MPYPLLGNMKLYPLVGLKSFRIPEAGGAWRLFVLAKNMADKLDHINRNDLRETAQTLGVNDAQWKRWITAGRNLDLFRDVQQKSGEWTLILAGNKKAAQLLGAEKLGQIVTIPAELLFKKGWRAYVFEAWQSAATKNGLKLISQKKQAEITGIDPQTQRQFNKQAGVKSERNYAQSNIHANGFAGVLEYGGRASLYKFWNKDTHQFMLGWRIPDTRISSRYGTSKPQNKLKAMNLFNRTQEDYKATMKAVRKAGKQDKAIKLKEVYVQDRKSAKGNNLWIHLPLNSFV